MKPKPGLPWVAGPPSPPHEVSRAKSEVLIATARLFGPPSPSTATMVRCCGSQSRSATLPNCKATVQVESFTREGTEGFKTWVEFQESEGKSYGAQFPLRIPGFYPSFLYPGNILELVAPHDPPYYPGFHTQVLKPRVDDSTMPPEWGGRLHCGGRGGAGAGWGAWVRGWKGGRVRARERIRANDRMVQ